MKKYSIILPTDYSSIEKSIKVGAIEIKRNKRVKMEYRRGGFIFHDSIIIEYDTEYELKEWLIFHSFIFNELIPIDTFDNKIEIIESGEECSGGVDYSNIKSKIYFAKDVDEEKISYTDLQDKFSKIKSSDRDLVINYLLDINGSKVARLDPIRDYS